MIIKSSNVTLAVVVPQKCGISTVLSQLAYNELQDIKSKTHTRKALQRSGNLIWLGGKNEPKYIRENKIPVDYLYGIVRDPIDRFVSAYKDRVLKKNKDNFQNKDISFLIKEIINGNISDSDFGLHCRPQSYWLGTNAKNYTHLFQTTQLNTDFKMRLEHILNITLPHVLSNQTNNEKISLTEQDRQQLKVFYHNDYVFIENAMKAGLISNTNNT